MKNLPSMDIPAKIAADRTANTLTIHWQDETTSRVSVGALRRYCPCAHCAKDRAGEIDHFIPIMTAPQTTISRITTVGSYALQIEWSDGHNMGMYEFSLLRRLSQLEEGAAN